MLARDALTWKTEIFRDLENVWTRRLVSWMARALLVVGEDKTGLIGVSMMTK